MKRQLRIRAEAEVDLSEAYAWYESKVRDLGDVFLDEVQKTYGLIKESPLHYQEIEKGVRRAILQRFPYSIYFLTSSEQISVIAVLRQSRDPDLWKRRL